MSFWSVTNRKITIAASATIIQSGFMGILHSLPDIVPDCTDYNELMKLYFEDISVGMTFESDKYPPLSATQIVEFASDFDPQPFHLDPLEAKETFFGGLAASGWHTAAITMRLMVQTIPVAGGLVGAGADVTWPAAVRPGDVLRIVVTVESVRRSSSNPSRGFVGALIETLNQDDVVVQRSRVRMLAFSKEQN